MSEQQSMLAAVHAAAHESGEADEAPAAATPAPEAAAEAPATDQAAVAAAREEGFAAGATAERERILGIEQLAMPGHADLVAGLKADGKTTPDQAAMKILAAEKAKGGQRLQQIRDDDVVLATLHADPAAGAGGPAPKATGPEAWSEEFERDEAIKAEFGTVARYVAFRNAEANGNVKVLNARRG